MRTGRDFVYECRVCKHMYLRKMRHVMNPMGEVRCQDCNTKGSYIWVEGLKSEEKDMERMKNE
jgi:predicted SprT family Zn-dependent metalloprotease